MADEISDFLTAPNGENFLRLRALIEDSPGYDVVSDGAERLATLVAAEEYGQAADLAADLMPNWLLSARVHHLAALAAEKLGDEETAARERYLSRACIRGLLLAGEGTRERPYPVLHVSDEYDLLDALSKQPSSQRIDNQGDGPCDVVTCADGSEVWFDVAAGFQNRAANRR